MIDIKSENNILNMKL